MLAQESVVKLGQINSMNIQSVHTDVFECGTEHALDFRNENAIYTTAWTSNDAMTCSQWNVSSSRNSWTQNIYFYSNIPMFTFIVKMHQIFIHLVCHKWERNSCKSIIILYEFFPKFKCSSPSQQKMVNKRTMLWRNSRFTFIFALLLRLQCNFVWSVFWSESRDTRGV